MHLLRKSFFSLRIILGIVSILGQGFAGARGESGDLTLSNSTASHLEGSLRDENVKFTVDIRNQNSAKVTINFYNKSFFVDYSVSNDASLKVNRLQVVASIPDAQQKSQFDDHLLKLLHSQLALAGIERSELSPLSVIRQTVELLVDMVPIGEKFDVIGGNTQQLALNSSKYTQICQERGSSAIGRFDDDKGNLYTERPVVGDPATLCIGRCGPGCSGESLHQRVYTQECLNHDLCTGHFGTWFGNCSNEWRAAAIGFLSAPSCGYFVIGTWQLTYTWSGSDAGYSSWKLYSDHTFPTGDGYHGVWSINSNKITLQYKDGCQPTYVGTVAADNLSVSGTMSCTVGTGSGSFKATYTTTSTGSARMITAQNSSIRQSSAGPNDVKSP